MRAWRVLALTGALCTVTGAGAVHAAPVPGDVLGAVTAAPVSRLQPFTSAPTPTLTGTLIPGQTVTAQAGTWSPVPTSLTYTFYKVAASGYPILVQQGPSNRYTVKNGDNTYRLKVTVTAARAGYGTTARTSATSLHVLTGSQRQLLASTSGDWQDLFEQGGAGIPGGSVYASAHPTSAYLVFTCSVPGGEITWDTIDRDMVFPDAGRLRATTSTSASAFFQGGTRGLFTVRLSCNGAWTLNVRPTASAPIAYDRAAGFDTRAYVYTGPAATRTLTADAPLGSDWMVSARFQRPGATATTILADSAEGPASAVVPAGPLLLTIRTYDLVPWRLS